MLGRSPLQVASCCGKPSILLGLLLCAGWSGVVLGQENTEPAVTLERAADALDRMDLAEACGLWTGLLERDDEAAFEAARQLEEWLDRCPLANSVSDIVRCARKSLGSAHHVFRMHAVASRAGRKYRDKETAEMVPLSLVAGTGRVERSAAPVQTALSGVPVDRPVDRPEHAWIGALQTSGFCFSVQSERVLRLRLVLPNPASVWLDGEPLTVRDGSGTGGEDGEVFLSVRFEAGGHCLDVIQAVVSLQPPLVEILPRDGAVPCASFTDATNPCPERERGAAAGRPWSMQVDVDMTSPHPERERRAAGGRNGAVPTDAAGDRGDGRCRAHLDEVRQFLENGEDQAAESALNEVGSECLATADGLLSQADLAISRQWTPLLDEYLEAAHGRYPEDCEVMSRWVTRRLERAEIPDPELLPVVCEAAERVLRPFHAPALADGDPVEQFREAGRALRLRLLPSLMAGGDPGIEEALTRLARTDLQVGWLLTDWWLSRGETARASGLADAVRGHPASTGGMRSQAGRLFFWERTRSEWTDPEKAVLSYLDSGFAEDMPQVVVLDEAVAVPAANGWFTLVQTTLIHLVSPDAAESVGEVSLAADEELVELAVRKTDGRWLGPEETGQSGGGKDTISLPGLAPGDFVLRRTIREVQADTIGGCHRLAPFYFGHRDLPVFLTRYVVVHEGNDLVFHRRGEMELADQGPRRWEFFRRQVEPVPAEPWCPDPEAGVSMVEVSSRCLDWNGLRDSVGDRVLGLCDAPTPFAGKGRTVAAIYEAVLARIAVDAGVGVFSRTYSETLAEESGSGVVAVYCSLLQAGLDAHLVAVSSAGALPLDLRRPQLAGFDGTVVYVAGKEPMWLDPYDRLSPPGRVRRSLAGRPGIFLTPRYPRLFVTLPAVGAQDAWKIRVEAAIDGDGALEGRLEIEGVGQAAAELRREADGTPEQKERIAAGVVGQVMPGVHVEESKFSTHGRRAVLEVRFARGPTSEERFLLLLPPIPAREFTQLPVRSSPLYFPGFYRIDLDIEISTRAGRFIVAAGRQQVDSEFGRVDLEVENSGDTVRLVKRASARPVVVGPEDYPAFAQFLSSARRLAGVAVEVTDDSHRN